MKLRTKRKSHLDWGSPTTAEYRPSGSFQWKRATWEAQPQDTLGRWRPSNSGGQIWCERTTPNLW